MPADRPSQRATAARPKKRWTAQQKAARDARRARTDRRSGEETAASDRNRRSTWVSGEEFRRQERGRTAGAQRTSGRTGGRSAVDRLSPPVAERGRRESGRRDQFADRRTDERRGARSTWRDDERRGGAGEAWRDDERRSGGARSASRPEGRRGGDRRGDDRRLDDRRGGDRRVDARRSADRRDDRRNDGWRERDPRRDQPRRGPVRGDAASRRPESRRPESRRLEPEISAPFVPAEDVVLERLQATAVQAEQVAQMTFADLGLGRRIVGALAEQGAHQPFPIQAATIPEVLAGRDVLGRGRTGSGKTIAFAAPMVERLLGMSGGHKRRHGRAPQALILAPTRELALQIDRTVQPIARVMGLFTTQIYGGVPQHRQVRALQRGVDIVIGTPGRIEDLIEQGHLDLSQVQISVLDEADLMCDFGFLEPVQRILRLCAPAGQKLLFSATLDTQVASLIDEFLTDPSVHEVAGEDQSSGTIDHRILVVDNRDKSEVINELAAREGKTLIFARTRAYAERLADQLEAAGIGATSLHGNLTQARRSRNLAMLTSGRKQVLVATDVAARGIHVDDVALVVQADMPDDYKTYLHRSGRTGRAGREGTVVTLIPRNRRRRMSEMLGRAEIEASMSQVQPGGSAHALS